MLGQGQHRPVDYAREVPDDWLLPQYILDELLTASTRKPLGHLRKVSGRAAVRTLLGCWAWRAARDLVLKIGVKLLAREVLCALQQALCDDVGQSALGLCQDSE